MKQQQYRRYDTLSVQLNTGYFLDLMCPGPSNRNIRLIRDNFFTLSGINAERAKAAYFVNNIKGDVKELALDFKDRASGIVNIVTGGLIGQTREKEREKREERSLQRCSSAARRRTHSASSNQSGDEERGSDRAGSGYNSRSNSIDESPVSQSSTYHSAAYKNSPVNSSMSRPDVRLQLGVIDEEDDENTVHSPVHAVRTGQTVLNPMIGGDTHV